MDEKKNVIICKYKNGPIDSIETWLRSNNVGHYKYKDTCFVMEEYISKQEIPVEYNHDSDVICVETIINEKREMRQVRVYNKHYFNMIYGGLE